MTGNTINATALLAQHRPAAALTRGVVIAAFVLGIAIGIVIAEECARRTVRRALAITVGVELVALVLFFWLSLRSSAAYRLHAGSNAQLAAFAALPAVAMGLQTAALRRVGGQTVRTVYISGMLTRFAEEAVRFVYWRHDRRHLREALPWRNEPTVGRLVLLAGVVGAYAIGALLGASLDRVWQLRSLAVPIVLLFAVALVDVVVAGGPPAR